MRKNKGFTMIELLIVIAVLGILAVAVLAAINPIEQINRGKDTGSRSDAEQLIGGVERYYASNVKGLYPWQVEEIDDQDTEWSKVDDTWIDTAGAKVLDNLSSGGTAELKESFINRVIKTGYNYLYKYNRGMQGDSTYVCFAPKSASFKEAANVRAETDCAGLPDDLVEVGCDVLCPTADGETVCYSCLP